MINQKTVKVKDTTYTINAFVGKKGFQLLGRLTTILAPVVPELAREQDVELDKDGNPVEGSMSIEWIGNILKQLLITGSDNVTDLILDLVQDVEKDGRVINVDSEFKCNYFALLQLAMEVVKLNYSDVFQELGMSM